MKKHKRRTKGGWFYDETWKQNVYLLWRVKGAADIARFTKRQFGRRHQYEGSDGFDGRCVSFPTSNGNQIIIALRHEAHTPETISTLAHECFHAAEFILEDRGVAHSAATSEVYAYLTDSIMRRCLRLLAGKSAEPWKRHVIGRMSARS